jgi:chromosome segregation ATPase
MPLTSFQETERIVLFGLYSTSYLNYHKYLVETETEDLADMLDKYNSQIAELTTDEQNLVATIVSKRYLASLDQIIADAKLETQRQKIEAEDDLWDIKMAALAADEAALLTLAAKVTTETAKTSARITELEAYIEIEGIRLSEVDMEILEKEIQSSKVDLQILNTANEVLKIQMQVVSTGLDLVNVDLQVAQTNNEIQSMLRNIAKTEILENNLEIEQAQTDVAEADYDLYEVKVLVAQKKLQAAEAELDLYTGKETHEYMMRNLKLADAEARQTRSLTAIESHEDSALYSNDHKEDLVDYDYQTIQDLQELQETLDDYRMNIDSTRVANRRSLAYAAVQSATDLAKANIATKLMHTIQRGENAG